MGNDCLKDWVCVNIGILIICGTPQSIETKGNQLIVKQGQEEMLESFSHARFRDRDLL